MEIYISGLRRGASPKKIKRDFGYFGKVLSVKIVRPNKKKNAADFAVINLSSETAVTLNPA